MTPPFVPSDALLGVTFTAALIAKIMLPLACIALFALIVRPWSKNR